MQRQKFLVFLTAFLILAIATPMLAESAFAQSSGEIASYAFILVAPNPVGVGQTTYVSMWVDRPLPDASEANNIRRHDYKLTIIAPDGTTQTKTWAEVKDTTGVQSTSFTPDKVGTYTFYFEYPTQTYSWNASTAQKAAYGIKFLGDTSTATLTVQQDAITPTAETPITTEYWSRPIYGEDFSWYVIGSHWLGGNQFGTFQQSGLNLWQQSGIGPGSSHIMWTVPMEDGGVVGGLNTGITGATYYSGGSYEGRLGSAIIMGGRLYYKAPLSDQYANAANSATYAGSYICRDLRTGEILWQNDNLNFNPSFGELYCYESPNQHGVIPNGYLWQTVTTGTTQTWIAYDGLTGKWLFNLTDVPSTGTIAYTSQGEIVKYILNYNVATKSGWLALWNWTSANGVPASSTTANGVQLNGPGSGTNYLQFRPVGRVINASTAYSWNVTITADLTGKANPAITYVLPGDLILGSSFTTGAVSGRGISDPYTVWAMSVADGKQGQLLWSKSYPAPSGNTTRSLGPIDTVNRVWTMTDAETMQWLGYSLDGGNLLWGPTNTVLNGMQYFSSGFGPGQRCVAAYGNLYTQGYGGEMFCYDAADGKLLWKYNNTNSGVDTSWGLMPIFIAAIADGKVYAFNNEHSPNSPLYKGYSIYCLNATTGEEIYKMLSWEGQLGGGGQSTAALADGSLVYYNYYDNQIYCIAKGPSQTTVETTKAAISFGSSLIIDGSVTDISAGASQGEQKARFPNGIPVASDASMSSWMEYVYMDQSKPTNFTGVPVTVNVIDANGNYRTIGTATTDASGYYSLQWTPDITGKFTVISTFAGTNSYYGSYSETSFAVDPAAATSSPQATQSPGMADVYFLPAVIGIIIAVVVVGVAILLALKKRP